MRKRDKFDTREVVKVCAHWLPLAPELSHIDWVRIGRVIKRKGIRKNDMVKIKQIVDNYRKQMNTMLSNQKNVE